MIRQNIPVRDDVLLADVDKMTWTVCWNELSMQVSRRKSLRPAHFQKCQMCLSLQIQNATCSQRLDAIQLGRQRWNRTKVAGQ